GRLAVNLLRGLAALAGRGVTRVLLLPITLYFLLRRRAERRDSRAYLTRVTGRPATLREVARHIHTFAATILDRFFLLREDLTRFDVSVSGAEGLHERVDRGQGVLLFGSHLG